MSPLARSLAVLLLVGLVGCSKGLLSDEDGGSTGAGGSAIGGGAIGGSGAGSGGTGGASAGTSGRASAGTSGGTSAGSGGATGGGGASAGSGGADAGAGGTTGSAGTGGSGLGPMRLLIFYTRWGTSYPEMWPTGIDHDLTMSAMLQPLEPFEDSLIIVGGLTNANLSAPTSTLTTAGASEDGDALITLLTARAGTAGQPAAGPSFDTAVGDCGGAAGPPLRLAVGQLGFNDNPGISFGNDGAPIRGERDPRAAAMRVLGHDVTAPDPITDIDTNYPALGVAHMNVAVEALATSKACVVTLMWGDLVAPKWLNLTGQVHELSHDTSDLYTAIHAPSSARPGGRFATLQRWYATQFRDLLQLLRDTPLGGGTLLDQSVVVWISESGAGVDHLGAYIPVVIAGRGGGRLDGGRFIETKPHVAGSGVFIDLLAVNRTQGDLLQALGSFWGLTTFGDPRITRQPLTQLFKP